MTTAPLADGGSPALIRFFNPLMRALLRMGMPMGPNVLLTVRGRKSGLPRSNPVALVEFAGRRWVIGTYGDVHWTRNLRSASQATIQLRKRTLQVHAAELSVELRARFFNDTLVSYIRALPLHWRLITRATLRLGAPDILDDPVSAAVRRPVFELVPRTEHEPQSASRRRHSPSRGSGRTVTPQAAAGDVRAGSLYLIALGFRAADAGNLAAHQLGLALAATGRIRS